MFQTLYSLIALALVMFFSLNLLRITTSAEQRMILNEVASQVTGIAVDLMEHVGNQAFDENTNEGKAVPQPPVFPLVTNASELTPQAGFGTAGDGAACDHATPDFYDPDCDDIDDFDGMTIDREVEGIPYTATIAVRYVDPTNPDNGTGGARSFAKEVLITVTSPYLLLAGDPVEVRLARAFAYKRITD